jgi:hypothetical protein
MTVARADGSNFSIVLRRGRHVVAMLVRPHRDTGLPSPDAIFKGKMLLALSLAFATS